MKYFFHDQRKPEKETALIALSLLVYVLYAFFLSTDFSLQPGKQFLIGQATLEGEDVGQRISFFYRAMLLVLAGWPVLYLLLDRFFLITGLHRDLRRILMVPCAASLLMLLAHLFGMNGLNAVQWMFSLSAMTFVLLAVGQRVRAFRLLKQPVFLSTVFSIAFMLTMTGMALWNHPGFWSTHFVLINAIISIASVLITGLFRFVFRIPYAVMFAACRHLVWIPLCIWLSIELSFWGPQHGHSSWTFSGISVIVLVIWLIAILLMQKYRPFRINATRAFTVYLAPAVIGLFVLHTRYYPTMGLPGDLFELANPLNAQMNLWEFHRIPCLDFMSSHMLSEQWYGWLYHVFFGYAGNADFLIYRSMESFLFYGVMYYFLLRILQSPVFSLMLVLCFPALQSLFTENLYLIMVLILVQFRVLEHQSARAYFLLIMFIFLSLLWRLDLGISCLLTIVLGLPLIAMALRKTIQWSDLLRGGLYFMAGVLLLLGVAMILRSPSYVILNIQNAWHYLGANQAHGYAKVAWEWNQHTIFFYVFMPFLSCLFIFYILYLLRYNEEASQTHALVLTASLSLFLFMLFNFQRGLVRHGFIEMNDTFLSSTFYLAVAVFVLYLFRARSQAERFLIFFLVSFLQIAVLTYFPLATEATPMEKLTTNSTLKHLQEQQRTYRSQRVDLTEANTQFSALDSFLRVALKPGQTVFDFSNSPSLYFFTRRNIPSYFCQSLQNTVDQFTQLQQLKLLDTARVPYVVYANAPLNWYDATDDVPNAMRYPYLAEYIYRYYKPFAIIGQKQIWIASHLQSGHASLPAPVEHHDYRKAAGLQAASYEQSGFKGLIFLRESDLVRDQKDGCIVSCDASLSGKHHMLLALNITEPEDGEVEIMISDGKGDTASIRFTTSQAQQSYMVRVSNLWVWQQAGRHTLHITGSGIRSLKKVRWFEELTD